MKYHYLIATLPTLVLGDPEPFPVAQFRASCEGVLLPGDFRELDLVLAGRALEGASAFAQAWHGVDSQLRNAAARIRASRLGVEAKGYLKDHPGFSVFVEKSVADAFAKPNPMERELALDRCRWQMLDEIAFRDPFGLSVVLAFAVKLGIVERWAAMKDEEGRKRVDELLNGMEKAGAAPKT